jgi:hypothetical protein
MPMKCIDQMPSPIAAAPPASHQRATRPWVLASRPAMSSAVYEARMATSSENTTRLWL